MNKTIANLFLNKLIIVAFLLMVLWIDTHGYVVWGTWSTHTSTIPTRLYWLLLIGLAVNEAHLLWRLWMHHES